MALLADWHEVWERKGCATVAGYLATRDEAEAARTPVGSKPGTHLYYPRSFFGAGEVFDGVESGYGNVPYRFNALLRFREAAA